MAAPQQQVLLLKTKSTPTDPYDVLFRSKDTSPIFVPVMAHRHVNLDVVTRILTEGQVEGLGRNAHALPEYGAMIVTSQRAVEALGEVLKTLKDSLSPETSTTPIYVVGPATGKSLANIGFPTSNIHGQECGTGEVLAQFILKHYNSTKKLLFLVGEVRRDIIPKTLGSAEFGVDEIVVYETTVMESFREDFTRVIRRGDEAADGEGPQQKYPARWVVIFSPTGSDTVMEVIGRKVTSSARDSPSGTIEPGKTKTYVATIGPTTATYLRDVLGFEPDVVAEKPSPEGLWASLEKYQHGV